MKARPSASPVRVRGALLVLAAVAVLAAAFAATTVVVPATASATQVESTFRVTNDTRDQQNPDLSDAAFVYQQKNATTGWDIYAGVLPGTGAAICTAPGDQVLPRVSGRFVVWEDHRAGNADIYGYDTETHTEFVICDERYDQTSPSI
ncbi:MAG TPA: hypothetical protein VK576_07095, partial [Thermoleophilia bacterium]|nr:hypothetical protein [Thermoleophilia bacterium]